MNKKCLYFLLILSSVMLSFMISNNTVRADINYDSGTERLESKENTAVYTNSTSQNTHEEDEPSKREVENQNADTSQTNETPRQSKAINKVKQVQKTYVPNEQEYTKNIKGVIPIDLSTYLKKYNDGSKFIVYVGFAECPHCRKFSPVIKKFLKDPNPALYYLDYGLNGSFSVSTSQEIDAFFATFNESFQFLGTPTVALIADRQVRSMVVGDDSTLEDLNQLVSDGEFKLNQDSVTEKNIVVGERSQKNSHISSVKKEITREQTVVQPVSHIHREYKKLPQMAEKNEEGSKLILIGTIMIAVVLLIVVQGLFKKKYR